ncbi:MAG: VWA domain-containing protein [Peptococcaceae bacterium]|nr:VWA domain-containing protein [Peptococcaceae bacterium]
MKRKAKRVISCLIVVTLVVTLFPATLLAALSDSQIVSAGGTVYYNASGEKVNATALGGDAVVSLSKTVKGTDTANEFIIELEVQTGIDITQIQTSEDAAVVLVLDVSGSMQGTRIADLKQAATNFLTEFANVSGTTKRYVSLATYATNATIVDDWTDITDPSQRSALIGKINSMNANGSTYTQGGLQLARNLLDAGSVSAIGNKSVILFTDGEPNKHNPDTSYSGIAINTPLNSSAGSGGTYDPQSQTFAAQMATVIKTQKGAKLYTIGCGLTPTYTPLLSSLSSGPDYAYTADNASELNKAFAEITESIEKWSEAWVVKDPMGENINFLELIPANGPLKFESNTLEWNLKDATPVAERTYRYSYHIALDTTASNFVSDKDYNTNGPTTLTYVMVNNRLITGDPVDANFLIPKVKGKVADESKPPKKFHHKKPQVGRWVKNPDVIIIPLVPKSGY